MRAGRPDRALVIADAYAGQSGKSDLRRQNRRIILEALFDRSKASRIELGRTTGLSPSTVGLIVGELLDEGYVVESGTVDLERGRKPRLLEINPAAATVIGVELAGQTAALFDVRCQLRSKHGPLSDLQSLKPHEAVDALARVVRQVPRSHPRPKAIGISVPGCVDAASGHVITSTPLGWTDVALGTMVAEATGLLVAVLPNTVCLALEEAAAGVAKGVDSFIYLHLGLRGIAAGIVVDGEILRGAHLNAGEIGHLQVDPNGPPCYCGKRGCLGVMASCEAVIKSVQRELAADGPAGRPVPRTFGEIAELAKRGNAPARAHLTKAARLIGEVIAGAINLVNPELIAVGGAFTESADITLPVIEETALARSAFHGSKRCTFAVARDASMQSARGAARAAIRRLLLDVDGGLTRQVDRD